jgi:serine protease Do
VIDMNKMPESTSGSTSYKRRRWRTTLLTAIFTIGVAIGLALSAAGRASLAAQSSGSLNQITTAEPRGGFADLVAKVKPAVVSVEVKEAPSLSSDSGDGDLAMPQDTPFEAFDRQLGSQIPNGAYSVAQGSGFFISSDGYAVTNYHVVDHAKSIEVTTYDGKVYPAKVVGTDAKTDLALIKVNSAEGFRFITFAEKEPRVGDWVVTVGDPFGLSETVTAGILSARGRDIGEGPYDDFLQIDAPINPGNSGGPTLDMNGNVIGVNTSILSEGGGSIGIGFAIPSETVKFVITQLKQKGYVTRGWLGVEVQQITPEIADSLGLNGTEGALIAAVTAGSPASRAGIKPGDVITAVNGEDAKSSSELAREIAEMKPGTAVDLKILRVGALQRATATLGTMPREQPAAQLLGMSLAPASNVESGGKKGVVITNIDPDGVAAQHGLATGDVILQVGRKAISTPHDLYQDLQDLRNAGTHSVLMRVRSGDETKFVALPLTNATG